MSTYLGNPSLKDIAVKVEWTSERITQLARCKEDPGFFIKRYVKVVTLAEGVSDFALWPFQDKLIDTVHKNRFVICTMPRQSGKALELDTPIPTQDGWTTMGELKIGDSVLGKDGKIAKVTMATEVMHNHECYRVHFDNGDSIVADADHLWKVRATGWRTGEKVVTTRELIRITEERKEHHGSVHIYLPEPVELPEQSLPIDPYVLGLWLGNGHSGSARFTQCYDDMEEISEYILNCGYELKQNQSKSDVCSTWNIIGLYSQLRVNNLLNNKHIPIQYLRGSIPQRLSLVQGLMDTDGTCTKKGGCSFSQKKKHIAYGFRELLSSLGIKSRIKQRIINGETYYSVRFKTHKLDVFRLTRKLNRQKIQAGVERRNSNVLFISKIEKIDSVPVRCIKVDNEDHMFLCGQTMVPTHNSTTMIAYFLHYILFNKYKKIGILANKRDTAIELLSRLQLAFELLPMWLQQGVKVWNKTRIELENGCVVEASATSAKSVRGKSYNIVFLDEFAHIENKLADQFWTSTFPVISSDASGKSTKVIIVSTPKGLNLFWELWRDAQLPKTDPKYNSFIPVEVHYTEVPGREKPEWADQMIAIMGDERFNQEFGSFTTDSYIYLCDSKTGQIFKKPIGEVYAGLCESQLWDQ